MEPPRHVRFARALALLAASTAAPSAALADPPPCPTNAPAANAPCESRFHGARCTYHSNHGDGPDDVFQCVSMPGAPNSPHHWRRMVAPRTHPYLGPLPPPENE